MTCKYSLLLLLSINTGVVLLSATASLAHDHHQQPSKPRPSLDLANEVVKAGYWYAPSHFLPANINCSLFTHLFAAFAYVNDSTYQVYFPTGYEEPFQNFPETCINSSVKILLSIGGNDSDPSIFAAMASNHSSREAFINSSIRVAMTYNYSGLSLNWQYPNSSDQMADLGLLLTEWRAAVEKQGVPLHLTADVFYSSVYQGFEYPIQNIAASLDWINVMAYDLYTPTISSSPNLTGPPAALYNFGSQANVSVDYGVRASWKDGGVPAGKIVLGLPFYGRIWFLVNLEYACHIFAPAAGPVLGEDPKSYRDIAKIPCYDRCFAPGYAQYVLPDGLIWIGFDGPLSIDTKVKYAKDGGLLGYFAWHVGDDTANWNLSTVAFNAWDQPVEEYLFRSA